MGKAAWAAGISKREIRLELAGIANRFFRSTSG